VGIFVEVAIGVIVEAKTGFLECLGLRDGK